jgi:hypothetical protein
VPIHRFSRPIVESIVSLNLIGSSSLLGAVPDREHLYWGRILIDDVFSGEYSIIIDS